MKTLSSLILESLSKPYPLKGMNIAQYSFEDDPFDMRSALEATFKTDAGNKYRILGVYAGRTKEQMKAAAKRKGPPMPPAIAGGVWEIHFALENDKIENSKSGIENTGDAFRVFATVKKFADELIKKLYPAEIHIKAKKDESNRVKLYGTFIKKFAPKMGYRLKSTKDEGSDKTNYILVKK